MLLARPTPEPQIDTPPNLPPGQYRIGLKVYQSWDLRELPIDGADERLLIVESVSLP